MLQLWKNRIKLKEDSIENASLTNNAFYRFPSLGNFENFSYLYDGNLLHIYYVFDESHTMYSIGTYKCTRSRTRTQTINSTALSPPFPSSYRVKSSNCRNSENPPIKKAKKMFLPITFYIFQIHCQSHGLLYIINSSFSRFKIKFSTHWLPFRELRPFKHRYYVNFRRHLINYYQE